MKLSCLAKCRMEVKCGSYRKAKRLSSTWKVLWLNVDLTRRGCCYGVGIHIITTTQCHVNAGKFFI
jgi:hypothetical protein